MRGRIIYRIDAKRIVVVSWFEKRTQTTPLKEVETAKTRLKRYDDVRWQAR